MHKPWENRPEFLPSLVVYSIAFVVSLWGSIETNYNLHTYLDIYKDKTTLIFLHFMSTY